MRSMLGKRPDEFGLVPDKEGYVSIKEFLKAIHEEPHMAYVRESHIREVFLHNRDGVFETLENKIRSAERTFPLEKVEQDHAPPKTLYKGIKRKSYPAILRSGLLPGSQGNVVMTRDRDLALRIARRLDQKPILLEIRAGAAHEQGTTFYHFGDSLYLADSIPVHFIHGPPLPKERPPASELPEKDLHIRPGSFILTVEKDPDLMRQKKVKKKIAWKEATKKERRRPSRPDKSWL